MEKNITFPADTKLLNTAPEELVVLASRWGLKLRQRYGHIGRFAALTLGGMLMPNNSKVGARTT